MSGVQLWDIEKHLKMYFFKIFLAHPRVHHTANTLTSFSLVAGDQVQVIHLIQLQQPISDPTNESSRERISKPTKRLE